MALHKAWFLLAAAASALLAACSGAGAVASTSDARSFGAYLSGRFAADEHDISDAAKFYGTTLDHEPGDSTLQTLTFFYAASSGDIDGAARLARRIVAATPDHPASRLVLAVSDLKRDDYKSAREDISKSLKGGFTTITIDLIDAWAAAGAKDLDGAAADIKELRSESGMDALAGFHQALILDYLGQNRAADQAYSEAIKSDGPSPRLVNAYGRFLERSDRTDEAKALYGRIASNASLAPVVSAGLARIAAREKPERLVGSPQEGAAEALFAIAASLTEESSIDVSILYLQLALSLRPDFDLANILLGDRMERLEKYEAAIDSYRKVDRSSPYFRMAAVQIATDMARLGHTDDAIAQLKDIARNAPGDVEAWTALGDAYRAAGNFPDASASYDNAISATSAAGPLQKRDWPLFYARAIARDRSHNWAGAEADLQQALKLSPDEPQALNYLGYSWVEQRRNVSQALAMLEKARSLKPYDGFIVDSVGWAYYRLGRYNDAARTLGDAILLVPGDPTINDHYGDALWKIGRKLDARFQWSHALAFGPEADQKTEIEKKLQMAGGE
ncbi:MAG TPA: tetratricopeptide repeat protein [Rhizomicrobium sp.]|jgi:tetratricopeptide (TPR) repeat protein|nr:tetratricopeptide repeat protein [Rhizomicrobium sp.]